jgi:hypothetical protein
MRVSRLRREADEGPSCAIQGKTRNLEIALNMLFCADEAPANSINN